MACAEEASLPPGLCTKEDLYADRNNTGSSLAPTIKIPNTRTRQSVKIPGNDFPAPVDNTIQGAVEDLDPEDSRAPLDCNSAGCRKSGAQAQASLVPVRLQENSVLVGQQRAKEKTLFLDSEGKTTTTPVPRRLRTRTRIGSTNGLRSKEALAASRGQEVKTGQGEKVAVTKPKRRGLTRVRGSVRRAQQAAEAGARGEAPKTAEGLTKVRGSVRQAQQAAEAEARGEASKTTQGLTRVRGSVRRAQQAAEAGARGEAPKTVQRTRTVVRLGLDEREAVGQSHRVRSRPRVRGGVGRRPQEEPKEVASEDSN